MLAGGVGGARFLSGLIRRTDPRRLTVIGNTGDDEEFFGLHVAPDLDTVVYTLAGVAPRRRGWGLAGDTFACLAALGRLGLPTWFRLGDRDLATHVLRGAALRAGGRLTDITADLCRRLGIAARVLPMSDDAVRTIVHSAEGDIAFQDYFVGRHCDVPVTGFAFAGIERARPTAEVAAALGAAVLEAIILCPSNPFVSIDPILSLPGMRQLITGAGVPVIAVSPIIGGAAVKGPAAKMMRELGLEPSAAAVAAHYRGLVTGFVMDKADAALAPAVEALGMTVTLTRTLMRNAADRLRLAQECVGFARSLRR